MKSVRYGIVDMCMDRTCGRVLRGAYISYGIEDLAKKILPAIPGRFYAQIDIVNTYVDLTSKQIYRKRIVSNNHNSR